jgi:hypothetical protein
VAAPDSLAMLSCRSIVSASASASASLVLGVMDGGLFLPLSSGGKNTFWHLHALHSKFD